MLNGTICFFAGTRSIVWYWDQCDTAAQIIVIILVCLSVWSFSTIAQKIYDLHRLRQGNRAFEKRLGQSNVQITTLDISPNAGTGAPYAKIVDAALCALRQHRGKIFEEGDVRVCMGHVENAIQRAIGRVTARYEKGMIPLSTFISGGPFLGLLGTVYGVMMTFGSLTEKASIAQLAPGVSGALVATTAGLLLAIPASFAYNWALGQTRTMATELDNFASALADQIEIELLEGVREERKKNSSDVPASKPAPSGNPFLRDDDDDADESTSARSRNAWE